MRPDERRDDLTRLPRDGIDCLRFCAIPDDAAPRHGEIGLRVGEALVDAAEDDDNVATLLQATHQLIADPYILIVGLAVALQPQKGRSSWHCSRGRNNAVDVDADLEARIDVDGPKRA